MRRICRRQIIDGRLAHPVPTDGAIGAIRDGGGRPVHRRRTASCQGRRLPPTIVGCIATPGVNSLDGGICSVVEGSGSGPTRRPAQAGLPTGRSEATEGVNYAYIGCPVLPRRCLGDALRTLVPA